MSEIVCEFQYPGKEDEGGERGGRERGEEREGKGKEGREGKGKPHIGGVRGNYTNIASFYLHLFMCGKCMAVFISRLDAYVYYPLNVHVYMHQSGSCFYEYTSIPLKR